MSENSFPSFSAASDFIASLSKGDVVVDGAHASAFAKLMSDCREDISGTILVVVAEPEEMADFLGDMQLFGFEKNVFPFPAWDVLPGETDTPDIEIANERVGVLRELLARRKNGFPLVVVAPATALLQPVISPDNLSVGKGHVCVSAGFEISPEALSGRLLDARLEVVAQVDAPGQFARRGGIVDVYPLFADKPVRLEFFGDEIDTVRHFDPATQQSGAPLSDSVVLVDVSRECFRTAYDTEHKTFLFDYLPQATSCVMVHPEKITYLCELYSSGFEKRDWLISTQDLGERIGRFNTAIVPEIRGESWPEIIGRGASSLKALDIATESMERATGALDTALLEMGRLVDADVKVAVYCDNAAERQRFSEVLLEKGGGFAAKLDLQIGHISKGFCSRACGYAVIGDHGIFGRMHLRRTPRKRFSGAPIADFTTLSPGDYVVHMVNGIACYEGMEALESGGTKQDYLVLRFAEDSRVYVPLSHIELVQRYVGSKDGRPKLSKLGGAGWSRRKKAAEKAVRDIAADLLRVQAVRKSLPGTAYPADDDMQREFDAAFPYEETPDQLSAIADIKDDQEQPRPMDRLLCGDVGFGKTEVAMRAAFKVINSGKQAAILVPTTILAEQHYRTFRERMADYPVNVGCLSRFRTSAEQKRIVEDVAEGRVDVVIGTHRLLSKDIKFRDLGLVVIDEEQRFGVEHKEKFKHLRTSVDVLTMSATPIPRTLHMSLLGLRDISNLATPPADRHSIRTMVVRYSDDVVRRAILRELARNGQCYFVHNRVQNIDSIAAELSRLVPEARFGIAHGQMPERDLLDVVTRFIDHKIDVLVTTTIIESGVDIPAVNTLFVHDADHYGLSQLHQLRGRVGRYRNQAYSYFLVPQKRPITPVARKRLQALEEYSDLGAGFRLAMRDLEIRGAGNVLGMQQSGHIASIGFDLYCRLMEKVVAELKGEKVEEVDPVELDLGTIAFVPTDYINVESQRIDFYRRLSGVNDDESLAAFHGYVRDRYGDVPAEVMRCFDDQRIRQRAADLGLNFVGRVDEALAIGFRKGKGRDGVPRLRTLSRNVSPLEKGRWRIGLKGDERSPEGILRVLDEVFQRLAMPASELREFDKSRVAKPPPLKLGKKAPTLPKVQGAASVGRREADIDRYARNMDAAHSIAPVAPAASAPDEDNGEKVYGVEPNQKLAMLGVVVDENAFDSRAFGRVTLACGDEKWFLRLVGISGASPGKSSLTLKASTPEEVDDIADKYLKSGDMRIFKGIVDDE